MDATPGVPISHRQRPGWADALVLTARAAADLIAPRSCIGCARPGVAWCRACADVLASPVRVTRPDPCPPGFPTTVAVTDYQGLVRRAVVAHKERGRAELRPPLAAALARSIDGAATQLGTVPNAWTRADTPSGPGLDTPSDRGLDTPSDPGLDAASDPARWGRFAGGLPVLVPIPSSSSSTRRRGTDPTRALVLAAARRAGLARRVAPVLAHGRRVVDQAGLTANARAANLGGALVVRPAWAAQVIDAPIVLVDDVVTTGATLAEAARALRAAGAGPVVAAVLAATPRRVGTQQ